MNELKYTQKVMSQSLSIRSISWAPERNIEISDRKIQSHQYHSLEIDETEDIDYAIQMSHYQQTLFKEKECQDYMNR